jgi:predicted acyltransferase
VLRGLAVLGMILVNNQGSGAHAFWGMAHADWNGWSPADLVFPTFLFVVGSSMALSMAKRPMPAGKAVRRAILLFGIGFMLNALPPTVLAEVRIMGVLQRIGLAFLLAYLLVRFVPVRRQVVIGGAALLGYWALVAHWPMVPDHSLPGMVDRFLLGPRHIYKNGGYDPEGLLSTIPATVSVLAG